MGSEFELHIRKAVFTKEAGSQTHRTKTDRGPEVRWWKQGLGRGKGARGVIFKIVWGTIRFTD